MTTLESPTSHLTTVTALYEAFGRGDVPSVLALMADDIRFDADHPRSSATEAGHPLLAARTGKDELLGFFAEFGRCELHSFDLLDLMASDRQVAVHVAISYTTPAGVTVEDDEIHRWTFAEDGRAASVKHYADTARHLAAWFPAAG